MTKDQLIAWAERHGYAADRFGHYQKELSGSKYRLKLSRVAVRKEVKCGSGWIRIRSGYYKDLRTNPATDQLVGLT